MGMAMGINKKQRGPQELSTSGRSYCPRQKGAEGRTWGLGPWKRTGPTGPGAVGMQHGSVQQGWAEMPPTLLASCGHLLVRSIGQAQPAGRGRGRLGTRLTEVSLLGVHDRAGQRLVLG